MAGLTRRVREGRLPASFLSSLSPGRLPMYTQCTQQPQRLSAGLLMESERQWRYCRLFGRIEVSDDNGGGTSTLIDQWRLTTSQLSHLPRVEWYGVAVPGSLMHLLSPPLHDVASLIEQERCRCSDPYAQHFCSDADIWKSQLRASRYTRIPPNQ